ncbi:hypothetical protein ABHV46_00195 [Asaia sp. BMEF1]|uniref:hypothetical protein n=1 Tax=Asaia sp. BMEF1 TaxID=3155932 RepID=UPI003F680FFD
MAYRKERCERQAALPLGLLNGLKGRRQPATGTLRGGGACHDLALDTLDAWTAASRLNVLQSPG